MRRSLSPTLRAAVGLTIAVAMIRLAGSAALAQQSFAHHAFAHHPFAVGANEGAVGHQSGLGAWVLAQESRFYLGLTHAVRATKTSMGGMLGLVGLSFAYGVFHAAGPGHGKAVITSYMVSNEVALRRGLVIALLAALLQGAVATALVGIAAIVFRATAASLTAAAETIEFVSYLGIVALGLILVWRKGRALVAAVRPVPAPMGLMFATGGGVAIGGGNGGEPRGSGRFRAEDANALRRRDEDCGCGRLHMPGPELLCDTRLDVKAAALAILTAGARPCSGAILVLVFALAQGIFVAGVAATFAMALGTAITTGALASAAVFAKDLALRLSGTGRHGRLIGRTVEFAAAASVLLFGIALLSASLAGTHGIAS